jgi:hypothetical protein
MSMPIVHHVLEKSQTQGSARTLLTVLAIHANDCCGVAWPSEPTLTHEVNISLQRLHELKQVLPDTGELVMVRRPGKRTLYFVAWHGRPYGPQGEYLTTKRGQHQPGCPLRYHPVDPSTYSSSHDPVGGPTDHPVDQSTDTPQARLRRQQGKREKNKNKTFSPSPLSAADAAQADASTPASAHIGGSPEAGRETAPPAPQHDTPAAPAISPAVLVKFGLRYGVEDWPPPRRGGPSVYRTPKSYTPVQDETDLIALTPLKHKRQSVL